MHALIAAKKDEIAEACRRHGVARLSVFGSAARGLDFDASRSDADLLVEFGGSRREDPYTVLKEEMETILGRPVDLLDREALDESRRASILVDAQVIYER